MISSKTIKLTQFMLLLIILTFLWIYLLLSTPPSRKNLCSFDDISACQIPTTVNRTFLFIIWGGAGFCSELNQLLLAFAYSVATKRRFIIDNRAWNYGSFADYFNLPSTKYYFQPNRTFLVENNRRNDRITHLKTTRVGTQVSQFWLATRHLQSIPIKRRVAHYLWKSMTYETLEFIKSCRIQNLSNYIGIHIRKGDKLHKEARGLSFIKYTKAIERILRRNATIQKIFVASDDHTAVEKLRQLEPKWDFISIYDNNNQKSNKTGHFQSQFNRLSNKQKLFQTRLFICELQMLIDSKYVLCSMSSNVCRLIQILRYQHPSTVISLDRSWYGT